MEILHLQEFQSLKPIECPKRGGINFPCAICRECEIGEVEMLVEDNVVVEKTVNSIMIHLNLHVSDEFEKYALSRMKSTLSKSIQIVQKSDWDAGDFTIMVDDNMVSNEETITKVFWLVDYFQNNWKKLAISAKQIFTNWENQTAKQISFSYEKA